MIKEYQVNRSKVQSAEEHNARLRDTVGRVFTAKEFRAEVGIPMVQRPRDDKRVAEMALDMQSVESPDPAPVVLYPVRSKLRSLDRKGWAKYVLMDGGHREAALRRTNFDILGVIQPVSKDVSYAKAFVILNHQKAISANHMVKLMEPKIRALNTDNEVLKGNINFGETRNKERKDMIGAGKLRTIVKNTVVKSLEYLSGRMDEMEEFGFPRSTYLQKRMWERGVPFLETAYTLSQISPVWRSISVISALWEIYMRMDRFGITNLGCFKSLDLGGLVSRNETSTQAKQAALELLLSHLEKTVPRSKWKRMQVHATLFEFVV